MEKTSSFSVIICGFMGSGKSTILREIGALSPCDHMELVDLDNEIVKSFSETSIEEIVQVHGWESFREREFCIAKDLINKNAVVSLGGGALSDSLLRQTQFAKNPLIWVNAPFDICYQRIQQYSDHRPLAKKSKEELRSLFNERLRNYEKANFIFDNSQDGVNFDEVNRLIMFLKNWQVE